VKVEFIDLKKQYELMKTAIDGRIHKVLEHGQFIMGPEVKELEEKLAAFTGSRHAIACASGTDALLIVLMALGVGPDDEVITTPFSFIATAEVISVLRARPVFVDIDPRTYNLDPALPEEAITPKTKAIIAVSLYGQCADLDAIEAIGARHSVTVIEDAAQSFGATYKGRRSCNLSTIGCTSFFPSKPLGCYGDGGACFTNDADLTAKMKQIRVHGQDRRYHHPIIGINGRIDTLQAAVLLAKFDSFPHEIKARAQAGGRYDRLLAGAVVTPYVEPHNTSVYAQYTVQVDDREKVQAELKQKGIPTAVHYPVPLHLQPAFAALGHREGDFPVAEAAAKRVLSLPMHPYISEAEQKLVADAVLEATALKASTVLAR
jgi:UDP-2-acetamido-2-deoxy-ribo-hexuluronate aminotransferase